MRALFSAFNRTWQELRKLFLELDTNRDGTITLEDAVLSQVKLSSYADGLK